MKNAYLYSDDKTAKVEIKIEEGRLVLKISNSGKTLTSTEQKNLFQPFMRGKNALKSNGLGLGLRIVNRILNVYGYTIRYTSTENSNTFQINF